MSRLQALSLAACLCGLALSAGCQDACLTLADQICSCQPDDNTKQICNSQAQTQEGAFAVTKADEQFCQQKLDLQACNCTIQDTTAERAACCNRLNTADGRAACGLVLTSP